MRVVVVVAAMASELVVVAVDAVVLDPHRFLPTDDRIPAQKKNSAKK